MQVGQGDAGQEWDGVRNYQARNNMKAMAVGDLGFFYHSGAERAVVGVVEVIALAHPDTTTDDPRWECVDIRAVAPFPAAGDARRLQGRAAAGRDGAGQELAPVGPAGHRRGMGWSARWAGIGVMHACG